MTVSVLLCHVARKRQQTPMTPVHAPNAANTTYEHSTQKREAHGAHKRRNVCKLPFCCAYGGPQSLGRVVPLCASNGSVTMGVPWTVVSSAHHVDWLPLIKQVVCSGSFG